MSRGSEAKDKKEARKLAIVLVALIGVLVIAVVFALPVIADFNQNFLAPGLGVKDAAIASFVTTIIVLIVFALVAGDGFIGEIQFMLIGFFAFFLVLWLLISWIF